MPSAKKLLLPGFSAWLFVLLISVTFLRCVHVPLLSDPDLGWHLRNAQLLLQQHAFPRCDSYTFSLRGHPWIDPEWLAEVLFFAAWHLGGRVGLELITIFAIEGMTLGVCLLAWQRTRESRTAVLAGFLFLLFSGVSNGPRTQLFGWLCFLLLLAVLEHFRTAPVGRDYLWILPPLFALWINLHGSWPIGIVFLLLFVACGLWSLDEGLLQATAWTSGQRTRLLVVAALCFVALFLNPYGWRLVRYPFVIGGQHPLTLQYVQEWQTLDLHAVRGRLIFLLVAVLLATRAYKARRWTLYEVLSLALAVFAGFSYSRFLLLTGIMVAPMLAAEATWVGRDKPDAEKPLLNLALIAAVCWFTLAHFPSPQQLDREANRGWPEQAIGYLRQHPPQGKVFNDFNWGGYLIWNLPSQPVFIDTRTDVFEETGLFQDYIDLVNLRMPLKSYKGGELRYVLFPKDALLVAALRDSPDWTVEYEDDVAVLLRCTR